MPSPGKGNSPSGDQPFARDDVGGLPYRIELWTDGVPVRVLARAERASLARAIFKAAMSEHPEHVIVLCCGDTIVSRSSD